MLITAQAVPLTRKVELPVIKVKYLRFSILSFAKCIIDNVVYFCECSFNGFYTFV